MAVVMMGGEEKKPILHDFLGMSCGDSVPPAASGKGGESRANETSASASVGASSGGHGLVWGSSDLGSERQGGTNSEVFQFHGRKSAVSGPEVGSTYSGRKRSNSDSTYMGLVRDRVLPVGSDSLESSRLMKMFDKDIVGERIGRSQDDEMTFSMQPPPRPTSLRLHPPLSGRPDQLVSKWEKSMPVNPVQVQRTRYASHFAQGGIYVDKGPSCTHKDTSVGATIISQSAADEGSRTGVKGSGILKIISPSTVSGERNFNGFLPCSSRPKASPAVEPEPRNMPSRHSTVSAGRQMTIFYAGQAHVFDDVHPNKADVIMALAGSNGGSWSTTYSTKSSVLPPAGEAKVPRRENEMQTPSSSLSTRGDSDHGLSQAVRVPITSDPASLKPGGYKGCMAVRDARPTTSAADPNVEGEYEG